MTATVTLDDITRAAEVITPHICRTPLRLSPGLSADTGTTILLKLETMQDTGAFKLRGATNKLLAMSEDERGRGVVAVSTGNHGRGVAFAARRLDVRAVICMSELVPAVKVEAIRAAGGEVIITGNSQDEAQETADRLIQDDGMVEVHPFDDPHVIAGQGTIGIELLREEPDLDTVVVPLSGGGLISGIALAIKSQHPGTRVIGVSMERGPAMYECQKAGKPIPVEEMSSLADSLGGGIGLNNAYTFAMVRDYVDDMVLVSEDQIAEAMAWLYWNDRIIAEGGGAVGVAALLNGKIDKLGEKAALVVSGCNVDMAKFTDIAARFAP